MLSAVTGYACSSLCLDLVTIRENLLVERGQSRMPMQFECMNFGIGNFTSRMENRSGTGYSGTPLAKKLGIKEAHRVLLVNEPKEYRTLLGPLSESVKFIRRADATVDVAHIFTTQRQDLSKHLVALRQTLRPDAALWISWPKKTSRISSDINGDIVREIGLKVGLVDVKVCAVDEDWSGLKFMFRKEDR